MDCAGKASAAAAVAAPLDSVRVAARGLRPAAVEDAAVAIVVVVEIRWAAHSRTQNAAVTGTAPRLVGRVEMARRLRQRKDHGHGATKPGAGREALYIFFK